MKMMDRYRYGMIDDRWRVDGQTIERQMGRMKANKGQGILARILVIIPTPYALDWTILSGPPDFSKTNHSSCVTGFSQM